MQNSQLSAASSVIKKNDDETPLLFPLFDRNERLPFFGAKWHHQRINN